MSASSSALWPIPTPPPPRTPPPLREQHRRQTIADQAQVQAALQRCMWNSGNEVISCYPTASTTVNQKEWVSFVWNSRRPDLTQTNRVDIFLSRADSQQQLLHYREVINPVGQAGVIRAQVNDTWFGSDGLNWSGKDVSYPFYWTIIRSDRTLDGREVPQAIFTAVQTAPLDSVAATSTAAASTGSSSPVSTRPLASPGAPNGTGSVQSSSNSSSFPRWAIAVIVVLGFLAVTATCILAFLILRRVRRRRRSQISRNSINSASPMIDTGDREMAQRYDPPASPLLPPPNLGIAAGGFMGGSHHPAGVTHDGASTSGDSGGPFSAADAAIMAQAFKKTLRQPDFAGRPVEEGESPEQNEGGENGNKAAAAAAGSHKAAHSTSSLTKELVDEGRDIRSVNSSKGVKVETLPSAR